MNKKKSLVLLSGGLDSSVNLASAVLDTEVVLTLTFDYGQRAAKKEIESAQKLSEHYKVKNKIIELPWFKDFKTALLDEKLSVPKGHQVSIDDMNVSKKTAAAVWIPNRNGVFLNIAAAYAEFLKAETIVPGFNREEAATFPDNSFDYMSAVRKSFTYSTANHVDVSCYTIQMSKPEIVNLGKDLHLPFEFMWPCYFGGEKWCGVCESCQRAKRAFASAKLDYNFKFEVE